jgi:hypothetical protein
LAFGALQGTGEPLSIQVEGVDAGRRVRIPFADLDVSVLEFLRELDRDDRRIPYEDDIPLAEHFEDDFEPLRPSFHSEDGDSVKPSLLDRNDPYIVEQTTQGLSEWRRSLWLLLDLVKAKPLTCLRVELDLAAVGNIDPEHDLVVPLIDLVDVATDEALPLGDEDAEIERCDGCLHGVGVAKTRALLNDWSTG